MNRLSLAVVSSVFLSSVLAPVCFAAASKDEVRRFGDWFAACDNGLDCAAGSLVPDGDSGATTVLSFHRAAAATAEPEFEILLPEGTTMPDRYEVDGEPVNLHPERKDDWLRFSTEDVPELVAAMRKGSVLALVDEGGEPIATASLAGATAAMLAIDEAQNRLGTTTALVRRGSKSPDTIPPAPALPEVDAVKTSRKAGPSLPADKAGWLRSDAQCDGSESSVEEFALDGERSLVLIACDSAAYNFTSLALTIDKAGETAAPEFDHLESDEDDGRLNNATFQDGVLYTSMLGRGVGDCGQSRSYVWDGQHFVTLEVARQDICGGNPDWPVLYRAAPVWREE
ncbi:DUF1176 domain-containing protein [Segnochrobactrum spirostomi]|uniref:DUF1176 domain-containing protein n=1 Tax=Segnochrobactrum spirostomi TaxID=2608987 RepID=A0A6A7YAQ6_9HYPH|nr:DUF1176 domain-containing protein [Segnochrobactrum spirostomi]MQT15041.1 DUF1176 domain-containing protein [Segnochrobactrum spirostomi]